MFRPNPADDIKQTEAMAAVIALGVLFSGVFCGMMKDIVAKRSRIIRRRGLRGRGVGAALSS